MQVYDALKALLQDQDDWWAEDANAFFELLEECKWSLTRGQYNDLYDSMNWNWNPDWDCFQMAVFE